VKDRSAFAASLASLAFVSAHLFSAVSARADDRYECAAAAERAQSLRDAAKLRAALGELLACARVTCPAVVREDCAKWVVELQEQMPTIIVRAHDSRGRDVAGVRVLVDGAPLMGRLEGVAVGVDPGTHRFRFQAASGAATELELVINEAEKRRVVPVAFDVALEVDGTAPAVAPTSPSEPSSRLPLYVVGGIGIAALGSFTYFELRGQSDYRALRDGCARTRTCAQSDVDAARTELVVGVISLGTAVLAAGVFSWLLLRGETPRNTAIAPTPIDVRAVHGGGVLEYRGRL
jgi:hypothetical protein